MVNNLMQDSFAFIIHPINPQRDVSRKFPLLGKLPVWLINRLSLFFPPIYISKIKGIKSIATGNEIIGDFVACPLTPEMMLRLPPNIVYHKIVQTGKLAVRHGARILGLGAFTSVVGDAGLTIASRLPIPVTTGDSYTIAIAVAAIEKAAGLMGIPLETATVAVVGAGGAIGSVSVRLLAGKVAKIILIGRKNLEPLHQLASEIEHTFGTKTAVSNQIEDLQSADLIITVTSAIDTLIYPEHLKTGAVICDVSRPRDVSRQVVEERKDVLVIEGGMVEVPGPVDFGFHFGFPPKMAYACMAETMCLALDQNYQSYTLGRKITLPQVQTIDKIASKHGFRLGGFRSFEKEVSQQEIASIKAHALNKVNSVSASEVRSALQY